MIENPTVGQRVWYRGDPNLGDANYESQIITKLGPGDEIHFDGSKRIRWIDKDVAFATKAEAIRSPTW
jgi:hypothetical protein